MLRLIKHFFFKVPIYGFRPTVSSFTTIIPKERHLGEEREKKKKDKQSCHQADSTKKGGFFFFFFAI